MGSVLDRLARAETSSDLRHYEEPCAVDVLKAAGIAAMHAPIHISLFRFKYLHDMTEKAACEDKFARWAYKSMLNRHIDPKEARGVGILALATWYDDTCTGCAGQKYRVIEGTPALSVKACQVCNGLGKKPIKGGLAEVTKDIIERADDAIRSVRGMVEDRLRG